MRKAESATRPNRYGAILVRIFQEHWKKGIDSFEFERPEIESAANHLRIPLPKNVGDVVYSFRYRVDLPTEIRDTAPRGKRWIIEGAGRSRYRFRLTGSEPIKPRNELIAVKVPDATPELISKYAQSDEQALLARVRYNRLIDIFLGIASYSLQSHLRTTVKGIGQIEIDEVYVGVDRHGRQFVVPVQAKGGSDKHGVVQTGQDIAWCEASFPSLICRPISAQFMDDGRIVLFEFAAVGEEVRIVDERHYLLVPADDISVDDLRGYASRSKE